MNNLFKVISGACVGYVIGLALLTACATLSGPSSEAEAAKRAVLRMERVGESTCSLTIISDTLAITAKHCVEVKVNPLAALLGLPQEVPTFRVVQGNIPVRVVAIGGTIDAAIVSGNFQGLPRANGVDDLRGEIFEVDEAVLCGYPAFTMQTRCVTARRVRNGAFVAGFETVALPGQSGGAVFTKEGKLIGIINAVTEDGVTLASSTAGILSLLPSVQ